jgi:hypothetical protein
MRIKPYLQMAACLVLAAALGLIAYETLTSAYCWTGGSWCARWAP